MIEPLRRSVALKTEVKRNGQYRSVAVEGVVAGDILRAGDVIPADALVLESAAFTASEAALTGEPIPKIAACLTVEVRALNLRHQRRR